MKISSHTTRDRGREPGTAARLAMSVRLKSRMERNKSELLFSEVATRVLDRNVNISVQELLGGIAHHLNNILTVAMGYAGMLRNKLPPDGPSRAYVEEILSASKEAADLAREVLAFAGVQTLRPAETDLNEMVRGASKLLSQFPGRNIDLQLRFDSERLPVMIDVVRFQEVLTNLISNAVQAMPKGGTLFITTEALNSIPRPETTGSDKGWAPLAVLRVLDTGTGMTAEVKKKMFQPFFTTKPRGEGVGLGLAIVYRIVKEHRGLIYVRSLPGKGTEVNICLPLIEGG